MAGFLKGVAQNKSPKPNEENMYPTMKDYWRVNWRVETKNAPEGAFLLAFGGVDGTRTRDPRRDRPVF